ncbi:spore germination protein (amino acid permease) [Paenibacillus sp. V4I3]|uniref:GerAB/ArcD/ProY family transporter n=2 Tax=unclassified Paenibacillus TaxID=185978 RepID=UPI0027829755|nr:GerAB/ArcD/ProY family transporter [Paenibacillus sp. V4I3]MDQ0872868.1 spore germination protein (amino acid permease) [Paenibacillus sp. V4I3]
MVNKISVYLTFITVHFGLIFFIYPEKIFESTSKGHWEAILIGCLLEGTMMWIYLRGLSSFPNMTIVEICKQVLGPWLSRILLIPIMLYFLATLALVSRVYSEMMTIVFLPKTPIWALLCFIFLSLFAAWYGIKTVLRTSVIISVLFIPWIFAALISSMSNFDIRNASPIWNTNFDFFKHPAYYSSFFAFSGFLFLGMIHPYFRNVARSRKVFILLMAGLFPLYLASVYIPLLIFGQETVIQFQFPLHTGMDTIDMSWSIFERMTLFYTTSMIAFLIVYSSVLIWILAEMFRSIVVPLSNRWLSVIITIIAYFLSFLIPDWYETEHLIWLDTGLRAYSIFVFPVVIGIIGALQRRRVN